MTPSIESMYTAGCWPSSTERKAVSLSAWPTSSKGESEGTLKCCKTFASAAAGRLLQSQSGHGATVVNLKASRYDLLTATTLVYFLLKSRLDVQRIATPMRSDTLAALTTMSSTKAGTCTAWKRKKCLAGNFFQGRSSTIRTETSGTTITPIWK